MRRLLGVVGIVLVVTIVAGIAFEAISESGDGARYPAPGRLIEVDGRRVRLDCTGGGSPPVILEAGLGESGITWSDIQPLVAAHARVCSYDRAGYGWSDDDGGSRDALREAGELQRLLEVAGEPGPYVLVGHSIGAFVVRMFASENAGEIAGLVLVDPTDETLVADAGVPLPATLETRLRGVLARLGVVRLFGRSLIVDAVGAQPPAAILDNAPVLYGPTAMATAVAELEASADSARQVIAAGTRGLDDVPVVILSAADSPEETLARRAELATRSPGGQHEIVPATTHYLHYQQPAVVVNAILDVVARAAASAP